MDCDKDRKRSLTSYCHGEKDSTWGKQFNLLAIESQ